MLVTLDWETYFSQQYHLKKLTIPEYVLGDQFKEHMCGIKIDDTETFVVKGDDIFDALCDIPWDEATMVCQNMGFDGFIASQIHGITPRRYVDTRSMSAALYVGEISHSLKNIAERVFPEDESMRKGDSLMDSKGLIELPPDIYDDIAKYCKQDVDLTYAIYKKLFPLMPQSEMDIIDLTARMFCQPMFELDKLLLEDYLAKHLMNIQQIVKESTLPKDVLGSGLKFGEWMKASGLEVPYKISDRTGKKAYAFAKTDLEFRRIQKKYPEYDHVWKAKKAVASTGAHKRAEQFLKIGKMCHGRMPVPLKYYGTHTGRYGGDMALNMQNLPKNHALRYSLVAPKGYKVLWTDSSNIEPRVLAWFSKEKTMLEAFIKGEDIYCKFGTKIYGRPITKADKKERFISKTAVLGLGYQMSSEKFRITLASPKVEGQEPTIISSKEALEIVSTYRKNVPNIVNMWHEIQRNVIPNLNKPPKSYRLGGVLPLAHNAICLPNGLRIRFPNLRLYIGDTYNSRINGTEFTQWICGDRKKIYGGLVTENIIQSLARIVIFDQMVAIDKAMQEVGGSVVLNVHDEVVAVVPEEHAEAMLEKSINIMRTPPVWAKDLPLDAEGELGTAYGK